MDAIELTFYYYVSAAGRHCYSGIVAWLGQHSRKDRKVLESA